jgi:hypothetical protein
MWCFSDDCLPGFQCQATLDEQLRWKLNGLLNTDKGVEYLSLKLKAGLSAAPLFDRFMIPGL